MLKRFLYMEEYLLQSIKHLEQLMIVLRQMLKHFLYIEKHLLQSIKRLQQLIMHLLQMLKHFLYMEERLQLMFKFERCLQRRSTEKQCRDVALMFG